MLGHEGGRWGRVEAQLVEAVEAEGVDIPLLRQHHGVIPCRCHLGRALAQETLHHPWHLKTKGSDRRDR